MLPHQLRFENLSGPLEPIRTESSEGTSGIGNTFPSFTNQAQPGILVTPKVHIEKWSWRNQRQSKCLDPCLEISKRWFRVRGVTDFCSGHSVNCMMERHSVIPTTHGAGKQAYTLSDTALLIHPHSFIVVDPVPWPHGRPAHEREAAWTHSRNPRTSKQSNVIFWICLVAVVVLVYFYQRPYVIALLKLSTLSLVRDVIGFVLLSC